MRHTLGLCTLAAAGIAATAMPAQAVSIQSVLAQLATDAGVVGQSAFYDFNDTSGADLIKIGGGSGVETGDIIVGAFSIESIAVFADNGGTPGASLGSTNLASVGLSVTGIYAIQALTVDAVTGATTFGAVTNTTAMTDLGLTPLGAGVMFAVYEDDLNLGGTDPVGLPAPGYEFNDPDFSDGVLFAELGLGNDGSYVTFPLPGVDLAIIPDLRVMGPAGTGINDLQIGLIGNAVRGTGTISPTADPLQFSDRASFIVNAAVIPTPAAVVPGMMMFGLLGLVRRRKQAA